MTDPSSPSEDPPLDYHAPQQSQVRRPESATIAKIGLFILGLIGGPLSLLMLSGFFIGISNQYGGHLVIGTYISLMVLAIIYRKTRALGIGMLLGPVIALFSLAVICASISKI